MSSDGNRWVLLNASPDERLQMQRTPQLHPQSRRGSPVRAIVLTNADVDHILGLFVMRESEPLVIWTTHPVREAIEANALVQSLMRSKSQLTWKDIPIESEFDVEGLRICAFPTPGKPPTYRSQIERSPGDNVGLTLAASGRLLAYVSGSAGPGPYIERIGSADRILFDGTFWSSDELVRGAFGSASAE